MTRNLREVQCGKVRRKTFSKIKEAIDIPYLVEVQKDSYDNFIKEGISEVLEDFSPITDYSDHFELYFLDHVLSGTPKYDEKECRDRDATFALPLREVPEVDAFHLAGTQSVEQHQREHQPVAPTNDGRRVDRLQQPTSLLGRKRQFAVPRPATAAPDSCGDIVAVTATLAEAVEEFHNGNEAVHRQEATPFALQVLLVLHDVPPFGRPRIDPSGRQPAKPQGQFAFVVPGRGGQNVALRDPLGDYFVQVQCRSHRFSCFKQWA